MFLFMKILRKANFSTNEMIFSTTAKFFLKQCGNYYENVFYIKCKLKTRGKVKHELPVQTHELEDRKHELQD